MTGVANIGSHRRSLSVKRDCFRNVTNGAPDSNENQRIRGWLTDFQKQVNQSQKTPSIGTSLIVQVSVSDENRHLRGESFRYFSFPI